MEYIESKIALVIKTDGLEYDDRVRKEIMSIQDIFPHIHFKIFAMLPDNKKYEGITDYGVPFASVYVPARDKYPSAQKVLLKAWQFQKAIEKELENYDAVWCANDDTLVTVALTSNKRVLWDLHEIPAALTGSWLKRKLLRYLFTRCKVVVHANPQRKQYLESIGVISQPENHYSLRNYPNFDDWDRDYDEKYQDFIAWKGKRKCVYLQGLDQERRASYESVKAIMQGTDLCAVVVGSYYNPSKEQLLSEYGDGLFERIYFVGRIPQLKIPQYVSQCFLTLVFYKNVSPNNYYCEANRFYQSVIMGLPVVVGCNPSMKEIVDKYGFGVAIEDDGNNVEKIIEGIEKIMANYDFYIDNINLSKDNLLWKNQKDELDTIVKQLLN